jgi:hypothetical protein
MTGIHLVLLGMSAAPAVFAFFGGGSRNGNRTSDVQSVSFSTSGNAAAFGNLDQSRNYVGACSSSTRGVWAGGRDSLDNDVNTISSHSTQAAAPPILAI